MARKRQKLNPDNGFVTYLRTSDEEVQSPERSQAAQRRDIFQRLVTYHELPDLGEYVDNFTGTSADRVNYQRLLTDARKGRFSHVFASTPDRFGRDDVEALRAIDEMTKLGICARFASHPDLNPADPDDRLYLNILFGMAKRESAITGRRTTGGMLSKLLRGEWPWRAPDGYLNREIRLNELGPEEQHSHGRYKRWVEIDPQQAQVWRDAWDLLLTDTMTLDQICAALAARGHRFRSGKPFTRQDKLGRTVYRRKDLSKVFHNWFYAGWVVVDNEWAQIPPKSVRATWKPVVSTEEFELGLAILAARQQHRKSGGKVHDYLLRSLVYVELGDGRVLRLTGSTPNAGRSGGGTSYYCIESSGVNILCRTVDEQIPYELMKIQVDPELIPLIRNSYNDEIADKLGRMRPDQRADLERKLKDIDEEEARALRLYTIGKITDRVWENLWSEWQDRRRTLRHALESLQAHNDVHIANLDAALTVIAKVGILYNKLERSSQKKLLHEMVYRVVVCPEGTIRRMELLPPFAYLKEVTDRVRKGSGFEGKTKTSTTAGQCSSLLSLSDPTSTESEPHIPLLPAFASDYMQFLELITFPQRSALELLFTQPH